MNTKTNARHQAAVTAAVKRTRRRWIIGSMLAAASVPIWAASGHPLMAVCAGFLCITLAATAWGQR